MSTHRVALTGHARKHVEDVSRNEDQEDRPKDDHEIVRCVPRSLSVVDPHEVVAESEVHEHSEQYPEGHVLAEEKSEDCCDGDDHDFFPSERKSDQNESKM